MSNRSRRDFRALLIINLVLLLFPPVVWLFANGNAVTAIGYFVVTGVIAVASLAYMARTATEGMS